MLEFHEPDMLDTFHVDTVSALCLYVLCLLYFQYNMFKVTAATYPHVCIENVCICQTG